MQSATRSGSAPAKGFPLHIHIGTLSIVMIVLTGGIIGWYNFAQSSRIILAAADRVFGDLYREIETDLANGSRLNHTTIELLARSELAEARSTEARLALVPLMHAALTHNERLYSLYAGYDDGTFFQLAPLRTAARREFYKAPPSAAFLIWSIEGGGPGAPSSYRFLDKDLKLVAERPYDGAPYDPRKRPWFTAARAADRIVVTAPYVFFSHHEVGATVALRGTGGASVVAGDITLAQLSEILARQRITPSTELALLTEDGKVLAYRDPDKVIHDSAPGEAARLATLETLQLQVLERVVAHRSQQSGLFDFQWNGQDWKGERKALRITDETMVQLVMAAPESELVAEADRMRWRSLLVTALLVLVAAPFAWLASRMISTPLRRLAAETRAIREFDFRAPVATRSFVLEIDHLASAMDKMKQTVRNFLGISADLSAESRFSALLGKVCREAMSAVDADAGIVYLVSDDERKLVPAEIDLRSPARAPAADALAGVPLEATADRGGVSRAVRAGEAGTFFVSKADARELGDGAVALFAALDCQGLAAIAVPLKNVQGSAVGVLCLLHRSAQGDATSVADSERIAFVRALAGVAAVAIDNQRLLKAQKDLLDAFIKLVAGAIDAKSPYTGGHCQRVPELTRMLALAACESDAAPFKDFALDEQDWETLDIACWLHDCGKVTTPEYVVDKATKLETLYDRIHEVRMRFEVLKRDADVACWKAIAEGADPAAATARRDAEWHTLDDDFAFVAECNEGGEFMAPERIERLKRIAARTWQRTLDDRIGISWEERARKDRSASQPLPASEPLLADRPEHLIPRAESERMPPDNPWGFKLEVLEHKYNRGELHNLSIARGTLSPEERYAINDHIVQTIIMLSKLPFPKPLRRVAEFAGGHHEKLDGTGYPKRLTASEMSLPARMMAIADIFEALTASDRPYKKPKRLSEAIKIMGFMRKDRHIDPELFELFLTSGVHLAYAERFLAREQIDPVDVSAYVAAG
ncbi:MAG: HD domain-containing phosphohydrolase [Burkholderiales bacterium]